ncbi:helix-turn-helix transcriptional regulator [Pseudomonas sp. SWRI12]|uniref:Helix-turn-helix transcriptional regulator n=1 Tax=Pseudomonas zanjanensis TaxID=2745496 RepID=A0A923JMB4_9PSED|nr:helix-turn-helix transcriptional regulator [Pseudomonas zanjanensis]MBV4496399.1 helix-turn-helix transcriptional regulator [Pseudomonas zanjanensis]
MDIYAIRKKNLETLSTGRTRKECAEKWGTSPSVLSQILSKNPVRNLGDELARRIEMAEGLANGFLDNVRAAQSVSGERNLAQHPDIQEVRAWDDQTPLDDDEIEVPFLKEVELSAGSGRTVIQESSSFKLRFGKFTLSKIGVQASQAVCVPINGNSMEPVLRHGATVGVDRGKSDMRGIVDGDIYAINHDGQLRVKQVYRLPGGGIRLRSFNRDEHADEDYTLAELESQSICLIGRVFWSGMFF